MSSEHDDTAPPARKVELIEELMHAAPAVVAEGLNFHASIAEGLGLSLTDLRYLNLIGAAAPVTAGELAARTGLSTGAITRVVDRLERAGYAQRKADPRDRRRVVIEPVPESLANVAPMYESLASGWRELLSGYDEEQLEVVADLFERMHELSRRETRKLSGGWVPPTAPQGTSRN